MLTLPSLSPTCACFALRPFPADDKFGFGDVAQLNASVINEISQQARPAPFASRSVLASPLNATGQSRVTLLLQKEHLRVVCVPCQEERGLTFAQKRDPRRG